MTIARALRRLFDRVFFPSGLPDTHEYQNEIGVLKYSDLTFCSASFCEHGVYEFKKQEKRWMVLASVGCGPKEWNTVVWCNSLEQVYLELLKGCFHDPNTAGDVDKLLNGQLSQALRANCVRNADLCRRMDAVRLGQPDRSFRTVVI